MIPLRDYNPTRVTPYVTYGLLGLNLLVFLYQLGLGPRAGQLFVFSYGLTPYELTRLADIGPPNPLPWPLNLFSSLFIHGGLLHLLGNMLYLWIFADNVEDAMGHGVFLIFYLLAGAAASLAHVIGEPDSTMPLVGASGSISGILGAYLVLYPRARIKVLFWFFFLIRVVLVPAVVVLGLWFLFQLMSLGSSSQVAFRAHIGGFVFGLLWARLVPLKRPPARA